MQAALGIAIILCAVFGGFMLHGGTLDVIWQPTELIIIVGGGFGAIVLGNPRHVLAEMWLQVRRAVFQKSPGEEFQRQLLMLMYELLQTAAGGLKALDAHVEAPHESPLFKRYPLVLQEPKL
ncbi:MAG: flagellar motor stator protein MotA, partial [Proteobacteria bacterium]